MAYKLTKEALLLDLYIAFIYAKKHKTSKPYVKHFERHLKQNLIKLRNELWDRTYTPEPSTCFIIEHPKKREVFAANFRDRIVHHLYYNYTHILYERTFIADTYSCIPNRGTHYGIQRLIKHIRSVSHNYQQKCYIMKLDKRGYFMHINRQKLLDISVNTLRKMSTHKISKEDPRLWKEDIDMDFVEWLTKEIVLLDPKQNCRITGSFSNWDGLDKNKSLFYTTNGCGLPIGNLTSQLFSNVYLNLFDQFVKRTLKCRNYGRYVDDSYIVHTSKKYMLSLVPQIRQFLYNVLGLELHMGKLIIIRANAGVGFLGAYIKPFRLYINNSTLKRIKRGLQLIDRRLDINIYRSINSYLGVLQHYSTYYVRRNLFICKEFLGVFPFNQNVTKMQKCIYKTLKI